MTHPALTLIVSVSMSLNGVEQTRKIQHGKEY